MSTTKAGGASAALRTSGLTKQYKIPRSKNMRTAVDRLDLTVAEGQVFGFLGPNGAGKTTTIKMLLSFVRPTSGEAWLFGQPVDWEGARRSVGYVPEQPYFPKFLTCIELVKAHGAMTGLGGRDAARRAQEALETVGMDHVRHTPLSQLSKGMTQRVGLACALIGDPKLLIMDEPSSGLDPVGRRELRELLARFRAEGKTIFLSSHLLSEIETVCDQVGVLAGGKLVACGAPEEIVQSSDEVAVIFDGLEADAAIDAQLQALGGVLGDESESGQPGPRKALVPSRSIYAVIDLLHQRRANLRAVSPQRETLEDAFLRLVKGGSATR